MNLQRIIISLSSARYTWDATESNPPLTVILIHVIIVHVIEGMWHGKEALRDDVVSKMIEVLYGRQILGGFNHNQSRGFSGF